MKKTILFYAPNAAIFSSVLAFILFPSSCHANQNTPPMNNMIQIVIGASTFSAQLADNEAAAAFKALLPLTIKMKEINGNEKYYNMPRSLPASSPESETVHSGDLMLWGGDCLVLFYKTVSTSYRYTRIGRINDTSGLAAALGKGNVTVSFESRK